MTFDEFLKRARAAGCTVENSGRYTFISRGSVIARYTLANGRWCHKLDRWRADSDFVQSSVQACARVLNLPRRSV